MIVTKESMRKARKQFRGWKCDNPGAPKKEKLRRMSQASKAGFEMELGLHTLPSIIFPMPEESARNLKKTIDRLRGR